MRPAALIIVAPALVFAQLQVSLIHGSAEIVAREVMDLGSVDASDVLEARFRVRNQGTAVATVHTIQVAGARFTLSEVPALPARLAAGASLEFSIRLAPTDAGVYSAVLTVNTVSILLRATATAGPVLWLEDAGGLVRLSTSDTVHFGAAEAGTIVTRRFRIGNPYATRVEVSGLAVQGDAFRLTAAPALPRWLENGESHAIEVTFAPASAGTHAGRLLMNGRTFPLSGTATEPPPPRPQIVLDPANPQSGQQVRLRVRLAERARTAAQGELRIRFEAAQPGWTDDPAIGFVSPAGRSLRFSVEPGADTARFDGREETILQTGATAGRLTIEARLGPHLEQVTLALAPLPVVVDAVRVERKTGGLELYLAGFDNARSVSQLVFTFYASSGQTLDPGPITVDAAAEFRRYFEGTTLGGLFALRAAFPVTGDVSKVSGVEVEIRNSAGSSRTPRVTF